MDLAEARERGFHEGVRHPWEMARVAVVRKLIRRHVTLGRDAIVLDIGCGDTFVSEQLAADCPDALFYTIDTAFTPELIERYRRRLNSGRIRPFASLDAIAPPHEAPVSLVLLMDVMEHIEDDMGFLAALLERPNIGLQTKFLITVPAYQALFCSHDVFLGHYRRYSGRLLRKRLQASGLRIIEFGYFFFTLLPVRLVQVVKERLLGLKPGKVSSGLVTWNGGPARAAILREALVLDASVSLGLSRLGVRLAGLSSYAICAKSAW
jgi:hypothetical protein